VFIEHESEHFQAFANFCEICQFAQFIYFTSPLPVFLFSSPERTSGLIKLQFPLLCVSLCRLSPVCDKSRYRGGRVEANIKAAYNAVVYLLSVVTLARLTNCFM
jgi:hypothetical protein